jgi:hypothetical protein
MLVIAAPGVDEGRASAEKMGIARVGESGERPVKIRMELSTNRTEFTAKEKKQ